MYRSESRERIGSRTQPLMGMVSDTFSRRLEHLRRALGRPNAPLDVFASLIDSLLEAGDRAGALQAYRQYAPSYESRDPQTKRRLRSIHERVLWNAPSDALPTNLPTAQRHRRPRSANVRHCRAAAKCARRLPHRSRRRRENAHRIGCGAAHFAGVPGRMLVGRSFTFARRRVFRGTHCAHARHFSVRTWSADGGAERESVCARFGSVRAGYGSRSHFCGKRTPTVS